MRDFSVFAICAFMYILIIILLQVCSAEVAEVLYERDVSSLDGSGRSNNNKQFTVSADNLQEEISTPKVENKLNSTNPWDFFQIQDPSTKSAMNALYGALQGNNECTKKSFCIAGNYLQQLPGRDFIFMFLGRYVPADYSLLYDIFRVSVMYGQNCEAYLCNLPHASTPRNTI